jgi:Mn2+/Fe2+ NRAMP family transporter
VALTSPIFSGWSRFRSYLGALGPGLMAGLSDNDPSGIVTYAISGAVAGYSQLWLLVLATFMVQAVQVSAARLGEVSQQGLLRATQRRYGQSFAVAVGLVIVVASLATLIADIAALGASLQLLTGLNWQWFVLPATVVIFLVAVICNFQGLRRIFMTVGLLLLSFVVTAFIAHPNWGEALRGAVIPTNPRSLPEIAGAVALLGTTVSPYLLVWQAEGERESPRLFNLAVADITIGYVVSNLVSFFIIVTTAATLHVQHQTIRTAADVANALRPLAGNEATLVFGLGLLAASVLAIPIFAISTGFAVCEVFGWQTGLSRSIREAPEFYSAVGVALMSGGVAVFLGVDPIVALFESQILNGLLMPGLIVILAFLVNDERIMGTQKSTTYYNVWLGISFTVMASGAVFLIRGLVA